MQFGYHQWHSISEFLSSILFSRHHHLSLLQRLNFIPDAVQEAMMNIFNNDVIGGVENPPRVPTYVEVAFIMSRYILSKTRMTMNDKEISRHEFALSTIVQLSLETNRAYYCQQLADVIIHISSRTVEGKMLDFLLEIFLSLFPQYKLPSMTSDLFIVSNLKQKLTNLFMEATSSLDRCKLSDNMEGIATASSSKLITEAHPPISAKRGRQPKAADKDHPKKVSFSPDVVIHGDNEEEDDGQIQDDDYVDGEEGK